MHRSKSLALLLMLLVVPISAQDDMAIARLGATGGADFARLRAAFENRNPGYKMFWLSGMSRIAAEKSPVILFVQSAPADARVTVEARGAPATTSVTTVGDIITLRAGGSVSAEPPIGVLGFRVPSTPDAKVPRLIRPDWDPKITDVPGGCATETGAYRRILLTWLGKNGPYTFHDLNAHRVRINDSFSHYHPKKGGFDEFYLVQMAGPDSAILTSSRVDLITNPNSVTREQARDLIKRTPLAVGDLVYLPRGVMHRGVGGALVQVITIPGFKPGAEIGVDHHLAAINKRLDLAKKEALPVHVTRPSPSAKGIRIERTPEGERVLVDDRLFTQTRHDADVPYLHPVMAAGDIRVTRNYPMGAGPNESRDHPHHRALWFAHGRVNGIDFWHPQAKNGGRIRRMRTVDGAPNEIITENQWTDADGRTVLTDRRTLTFQRLGQTRVIDFDITLHASHGDVTFGDTKEGTMAIRLAPELRLKGKVAAGRVANSNGTTGKAVWGKRAAWVSYSGKIGGKPVSVTMVDHKGNVAHPTWWHARDYGLFAANPFGAHDFERAPKGRGAVRIENGKSLRLRYRVVVAVDDAGRKAAM